MIGSNQNSIFLIDDEENVVESLKSGLEQKGFSVQGFTSAADALDAMGTKPPSVVVTDILMPDIDGIDLIKRMKRTSPELSFVVITAHASLDSAIEALRLGVVDYLVKPFRLNDLASTIQKAMSETRLVPAAGAQSTLQDRYRFKNLISCDPRMLEAFKMISRIAKTTTTVLIMGESGTGKEMIARSIHYNSKRRDKSFIGVNCAALPETLLESELFGYEKGAFTGASTSKPGLFEMANGGTFFLDEVGEIPLSLQAKLLRVLQERVVKHLGGLRDIPIDIRLIAATSKNLPKETQEGRFREDLFYRLNVVPIVMPPLRERPNDIKPFLEHFISFYTRKLGVTKKFRIEEDGLALLKKYHWPGNIRELENLVERIVTIEDDEIITAQTLEKQMGEKIPISQASSGIGSLPHSGLSEAVEGLEKRLIMEALKRSKGNKFKAARELGLTRQNLQYKVKKYDLDKDS